MPQVDVQWPSEDEDFDTTAGGVATKTAPKTQPSIIRIRDEALSTPTETDSGASAESEKKSSEQSTRQSSSGSDTSSETVESPEATVADSSRSQARPAEKSSTADEPLATANAAGPPPIVKQPAVSQVSPSSREGMGKLRLVIEATLLLAVIGLGLWVWNLSADRKNLQNQVASLKANPQAAQQKQTQALIQKVGKLIQLPTGETPTVAEVSNAAQAKQQSSFFNNAQNGDRVLMYVKAGEAILYRPSTNKVILVAPLVFTNSNSSSSSSNTSSSPNKPATSSSTPPTSTTGATTTPNKSVSGH